MLFSVPLHHIVCARVNNGKFIRKTTRQDNNIARLNSSRDTPRATALFILRLPPVGVVVEGWFVLLYIPVRL